jgi:hypothetical protein
MLLFLFIKLAFVLHINHYIGGTADYGRWISDAQWSDASRRA